MFVEINLEEILPKKSYTGEDVLVKKSDSSLIIYYLSKYSNGKLKTQKFQPAKAKLPKKIKLSEDLMESMGLYFGDGQKAITSKSYQAMRFANSDARIIKKFLKALQKLKVKNNNLKVYVRISTLRKNTKPIAFWSKITNIPKKNFYKISWQKSKHKTSKAAQKGTITLILANSSFRLVFDALYKHIKTLAKYNKDVAAPFLRGIIAADGTVYFDGRHREVSIAAKYKKDRIYIKKLLSLLEILPNKDNLTPTKEAVTITGFSNLTKIQKHNLCSLHPKKELKLNDALKTYKNICYRKGVGKLKVMALLKENPSTVTKLAKKLNRKENAVRRYLRQYEKEGKAIRKTAIQTSRTGRYAEVWVAC
ncbi:hypothetical protein GF374_01695 [Candidatus Woesearchaeota archaeon]|nr:hypothetical protein [Candidatus Woesearchaeota archaeon]